MGNLKHFKEKLKSVKNTSKITKAMKLVSTVKLKRAEELAKRSKSYEDVLTGIMKDISAIIRKYGAEDCFGNSSLFQKDKKISTADIILVTSDKGMCGSFNSRTIKSVLALVKDLEKNNIKVRLKAAGKKGNTYFSYRGHSVIDFMLSSNISHANSSKFINESIEDFNQGITDQIILVHNGFKNKLTQEVIVKKMLPFDETSISDKESGSFLDVEPDDPEEMINALVKKYIEFSMYYALVDSLAAEHSSRMQAMDTATKNAEELTRSLTIDYNKARQAAVTNELVEIISGVESMK